MLASAGAIHAERLFFWLHGAEGADGDGGGVAKGASYNRRHQNTAGMPRSRSLRRLPLRMPPRPLGGSPLARPLKNEGSARALVELLMQGTVEARSAALGALENLAGRP